MRRAARRPAGGFVTARGASQGQRPTGPR